MNIIPLHQRKNLDTSVQEWFGFDEETPVVWVKYSQKNGRIELWTIETRPEYRNQGYSKQALQLLKDKYGVDEIYHCGGYTPEGFEYICPQVKWVSDGYETEPKANFRSMDFVDTWDIRYAY